MSFVFVQKQTVFFVGGRGDQSGRIANAGGCIKTWWDAESPNKTVAEYAAAMAKLMTGTGAPIVTRTADAYTVGDDRITAGGGLYADAEVGMVAYVIENPVPGVDVDTGHYLITDVDVGGDWIELSDINGTGDADVDVYVGGALDKLETAVSRSDATLHSVMIHTNLDETLAATVTVASGGTLLKNTFKRISGFNTTPGDMKRGADYYQTPFDILLDGSIDSDKCVTLDGDANAFHILTVSAGIGNLTFENIHFTGTTGSAMFFATTSIAFVFRNCRFSDIANVITGTCNHITFDSCYSNNDITGHQYVLLGSCNILLNCIAKIGATNFINYAGGDGSVLGCITVGGVFLVRMAGAGSCALVSGNTFYGATTYGVLLDGANTAKAFNNIFCLAPGAIGIYSRSGGSLVYNDYNCFIETDGTPLTPVGTEYAGGEAPVIGEHSIEVDPLFVDAGNNNFRLQSDSPCRRVGHPTIGAV